MIHSLFVALAGDYRLEVAARLEDFPGDPQATQRSNLHHQINNSGDILFSAHWRDFNGFRRSAIYAGPPGDLRAVVEGGDRVLGFPNVAFAGGPDQASQGNFPQVTFNAQGEVWFTAFVVDTDPAPGTSAPFSQGFWKASGGREELVGADPGFEDNFSFPFNVNSVPYSGFGRLQWTGFRGFSMTDYGDVFFSGDIKAYRRNVGLEFVLDSGLIIYEGQTNQMYVITYPRAPVPGSNDWVFSSINLYHVGHKNGALVLDTILEGIRTNVNLGERKRVFYTRLGTILHPVYTEKDPLPDLPPLSEVLGTDEPFDLLSTLLGADGNGNFIFAVNASARNRIATAPMGIWKWDGRVNKLVKVLRFQEPLPTPTGPVRLDTNIAIRAKIGNNKAVFVAGFTGLGYTSTTTGLFQENGTNFTLLAATGMVVPGTNANFVLGPNIGSGLVSSDFYANESNEVLFAASFRTNATGPASQGMWAWRNGTLQSVIRAGQQISVRGTNRTIRAFGYSALHRVFNDLGMFMAIPTFTDGTSAIVRASPEADELPCCESQRGFGQVEGPLQAFDDPAVCDLFTFTGDLASTNWHSPNWDDGRGQPHCDPPGDAAPNTARVVIPALSDVLLDQRAAPIGSLDSGGILTLRERLTVNNTASATELVVEGPTGGVTLTNGAQMTVDNTLWKSGSLSMADGQIPASFASLDTFLAESGTIEALSGNPVFETYATFRKDGPGEFAIRVPFNAIKTASGAATLTEVFEGTLTLSGGGIIEDRHTFIVARGTTLELSGKHQVRGAAFFRTNGNVHFGTSDRPIILESPPGSALFLNVKPDREDFDERPKFDLRGNGVRFHRGELVGKDGTCQNDGRFFWQGGQIAFGESDGFDLRDKPRFVNNGFLAIDEDNLQASRRLDGLLINNSIGPAPGPFRLSGPAGVLQFGSFELNGVARNRGKWYVFRPATISGSSGAFINDAPDAEFAVELDEPGEVLIESSFRNRTTGLGYGFRVGRPFEHNQRTVVELRGSVAELVGTQLGGGKWYVHTNCSLKFPSDIEGIGPFTYLSIHDGDNRSIPSLKLRENHGTLNFWGTEYATPPGKNLVNGGRFIPAELGVKAKSTLTVNGSLTNWAALICDRSSKIVVTGDLVHENKGYIEAHGQILVSGNIRLDGYGDSSGVMSARDVTANNALGIGSSPGMLTVIGSMNLASSSTLSMEVAGIQTNQFDILSVTGIASLSGQLALSVINDFRPAAGDSFPIVQATSISGQFSNAPNGQRLATIDGYGSFQVNYTPTNIVLSAFELNPTPTPTAPATLNAPILLLDSLQLKLTGTAGREYLIETSTNLVTWSIATTNVAGFDGASSIELPASADPYRFFRARAK